VRCCLADRFFSSSFTSTKFFSGNGLLNTPTRLCQVLYYIHTWYPSHWFALKKGAGSAILQHLQQTKFYPKYTLTSCFCLFK
jgi:hypothetical protein